MRFETKAIRLQTGRTQHREHSTPLFPTSSFVFDSAQDMQAMFAGEKEGNIYSRYSNPNCSEFEAKMMALEGAEDAVSTASGMAAIFSSMAALLQQGDHVLASRALFGSSYQILTNYLPKWGISHSFVDAGAPETWASAVRPNTKMLFVETPSNPGLDVIDLEWAAAFAKSHKLILNVDNCFATPYLQNPIRWGADLVTHSATKFIDGQGRVLGGLVAGKEELVGLIRKFNRQTGPSLSPFNAWVLSKSLETLAVRLDRHCANALTIAKGLSSHALINRVNYPFMDNHPMQAVAKKQMRHGGGLVTIELKGGLEHGQRFLNNMKLLSLSSNLGDTRTIATHPATSTHSKLPKAERLRLGISDGLIRLSIGLEHVDDILEDIEQALD